MFLGGMHFFVLMLLPVAEEIITVAHTAAVINTADQRPNLDISQLAQLGIDPVLFQFIGNVVTELKEVKTELHVVKNDNMALKNMTQVLETKNLALQNRTQILEVENKAVRAELKQVKRDKAAFENKTRVIQGQHVALHAELSKVLIVVAKLQNQTTTNILFICCTPGFRTALVTGLVDMFKHGGSGVISKHASFNILIITCSPATICAN